MIAQVGFDTLAFVKRLSAAGMDPPLAEAPTEALADNACTQLATKADVKELRADIEGDGAEARQYPYGAIWCDDGRFGRADRCNSRHPSLAVLMGTTEPQATELVASIKAMELRLVAELKDLEYQLTVRFMVIVGIGATFIVAILGPLIILD